MTLEELQSIIGTDQFPTNVNDVYNLIETIAIQEIRAVQSANRLVDATFDYDVENGQVIQSAVIEMAKSTAYNKNAYDRAPKDPTVHVRYFSDYKNTQFETTIRRDDIRRIIANRGVGVEDVIAQIISTLTSGESHEDFIDTRDLILNDFVPDYSKILGGTPKNLKGVIYAARNMYNHLKSDNSDLTEGAGTENAYVSSTPAQDIRVAMTESLLNLIDVVELANIFNLTKEELFGVMVVIPDSDLPADKKYKVVVYDRKSMGKALFTYDFTQEPVAKGRFLNQYLTVSRCYFYNELFKACQLDCTQAAQLALGEIIEKIPTEKFVALESTDVLTAENNLAVDLTKTKEEIESVLAQIATKDTSPTFTRYVIGSSSETATSLLFKNVTGTWHIYYNDVDIYSGGKWADSKFDEKGVCNVTPRGAVGEIYQTNVNLWNGVFIGKIVKE